MGLITTAKNADYSDSYADFLWPVITETSDLKALFVPRLNFDGSSRNRATGEVIGTGGQLGSPTYNADSVAVTPADSLVFNVAPTGINHTMMLAAKSKTGGALGDAIIGASGASPVTEGLARVTLYNRRFTVQANSYPAGNAMPSSGGTTLSTFLDLTASYDGLLEIFFMVLESGVSAKLYHPKTGASNSVSATGRDFGFAEPTSFRTVPNGSAGHDVGAFGYWSRALTDTQMDSTYDDIKAFYARVGISV